ncbi:MAG: M23 family metallopeptidase [Epulopiscium sp.]|nr:M23 family metallopeptidase [Candidatus Epulonipiscium sp.]
MKPYFYENTWKVKRTYGGERLHFGTDIMDIEDERGRLPIVSMTSGVIEKIGWNEKGGWRVGIRAPHGAYFYYAHFFMYAPDLYEGMHVESGQLLGYMGDSGYGKKENTMGHFPVHLHLGILLTIDDREVWINPYEILRYLEKEFLF